MFQSPIGMTFWLCLGTAVLERIAFWKDWIDFMDLGGVSQLILRSLRNLRLLNPCGAVQPAGLPSGP